MIGEVVDVDRFGYLVMLNFVVVLYLFLLFWVRCKNCVGELGLVVVFCLNCEVFLCVMCVMVFVYNF